MSKGLEKRRRKELARAAFREQDARQAEWSFRRYRDAAGRPRCRLTRAEMEKSPWLAWNGFVDLLTSADYDELTPVQRTAWLAYHYDSEMQNGGHLLYFDTIGAEYVDETTRALERIGARDHGRFLSEAAAKRRQSAGAVDAGVDYSELDEAYYGATPDVQNLLEQYLKENEGEFLVIEE